MKSVISRVGTKSTVLVGPEEKKLIKKCVAMIKRMEPAKMLQKCDNKGVKNELIRLELQADMDNRIL